MIKHMTDWLVDGEREHKALENTLALGYDAL